MAGRVVACEEVGGRTTLPFSFSGLFSGGAGELVLLLRLPTPTHCRHHRV